MRTAFAVGLAVVVVSFVASEVVLSQGEGGYGPDPFADDSRTQPQDKDRFGPDPFGDAYHAQPATELRPRRALPPAVQPPLTAQVTGVLKAAPTQRRIWASPGEKANEPIRRVLAKPLTSAGLDFVETPLEETVEFLRDEYEIPIQMDVAALDDLGLRPDEPVTCAIEGVTLRAALKLMLGQLELTAIPADGVLHVTTQEEAETRLKVALYPVADLGPAVIYTSAKTPPMPPQAAAFGGGGRVGFGGGFAAAGGGGGLGSGGHSGMPPASSTKGPLIDTIMSCIATETWAENGGGEADLSLLPNGVLVVTQTEAAHDHVLAFLTALREASPPPAPMINGAFFPAPVLAAPVPSPVPTAPQPAAQARGLKPRSRNAEPNGFGGGGFGGGFRGRTGNEYGTFDFGGNQPVDTPRRDELPAKPSR